MACHPSLHHRLAQLAERDLFDLPHALGADAELLAELAQRRLAPVEAEARADDRPLTLVEHREHAGQLLELELERDAIEGLRGTRVVEHLAERDAGILIAAD